MKVIHIPYSFHPENFGGTEIYVKELAISLKKYNVTSIVLFPGKRNSIFYYKGIKVYEIEIPEKIINLNELYGAGNKIFTQNFFNVILKEKPDIIHIHSYTRAISSELVKNLKKQNIKLIFTYHTPTVGCLNGTLLFMGRKMCLGNIRTEKCSFCFLYGLLSRYFKFPIFVVPLIQFYSFIFPFTLKGKVSTALSIYSLTNFYIKKFKEFLNYFDKIVVQCKWSVRFLISNNIDSKKLFYLEQGIKRSEIKNNKSERNNSLIKFGMFGRLHPVKGFDIVLKGMKKIKNQNFIVDIFGIYEDSNYLRKIQKIIEDDKRFKLKKNIPNEKIYKILKEYDAIIIPSQLLETGPLILLECMNAKVPVIGSNLGGIAERIKNTENGIIVDNPFSPVSWQETIERVLNEKELLKKIKENIKSPYYIDFNSKKIYELYNKVLI